MSSSESKSEPVEYSDEPNAAGTVQSEHSCRPFLISSKHPLPIGPCSQPSMSFESAGSTPQTAQSMIASSSLVRMVRVMYSLSP